MKKYKGIGSTLESLLKEEGIYEETVEKVKKSTGVYRRKMKLDYEVSSGNVFADLGLPNPDELLAKADLTIEINKLIEAQKLSPTKAAKLLGIDKTEIATLNNHKLFDYSIEQLTQFKNRLTTFFNTPE